MTQPTYERYMKHTQNILVKRLSDHNIQQHVCNSLEHRENNPFDQCSYAISSDAYILEFNHDYLTQTHCGRDTMVMNVTHNRYYLCHRTTPDEAYATPYLFHKGLGVHIDYFELSADDLVPFRAQQALLYSITNHRRHVINMLIYMEQRKHASNMNAGQLLEAYRQAITYRTADEIRHDLKRTYVANENIQDLNIVYTYLGYDCLHYCAHTMLFQSNSKIKVPSMPVYFEKQNLNFTADLSCLQAMHNHVKNKSEQKPEKSLVSNATAFWICITFILLILCTFVHFDSIKAKFAGMYNHYKEYRRQTKMKKMHTLNTKHKTRR